MSKYDNRGQASLWRPQSRNPKAPALSGKVIAHRDIREGEELDIVFWNNKSDNPKAPILQGKIQDPFNKRADNERSPDPRDYRFDDGRAPWE